MATIPEALSLAVEHHQAGRLAAAEQIYRQVLAAQPDHPQALHLLGVLAHQVGQHAAAAECVRRAIAQCGEIAAFHNTLGNVLAALEQPHEAIAAYRRALELQPDYAQAHHNLGNALYGRGQLDAAVACYRRALAGNLNAAAVYFQLGNALRERGDLDAAADAYHRALQQDPRSALACHNLGNVYYAQVRLDEALACYRRALELQPDAAQTCFNVGVVLQEQARFDEAAAAYRRAIELHPHYAQAYNNLGSTLHDQRLPDAAIACFRRALELDPGLVQAENNLGNALCDQGLLPEAIACYRRALQIRPDQAVAHSNLVYAMNFAPDYDPPAIRAELQAWQDRHAAPLTAQIRPHGNERSPQRRVRIGYVSPDFRWHPVGRFLLPLLEAHDHARFEIFAYASQYVDDELTPRCRRAVDTWRNVVRLSDEQLAAVIRDDRIDILVDLTMHLGRNRMLLFARKPAPVQVTYLAYCGSTGLAAIDYRFTDPYLDPPGWDDRYAELSLRLADTYWCYQPLLDAPPVNALPAAETGRVTFGCLNNFCKASPPALAAWGRILAALPDARLVLHAYAGSHRQRAVEALCREGAAPQQIEFVTQQPREDYFRTYHRIDVGLDPFPYGGGTTTCDALWMGVPVVSLVGDRGVGRGGVSILSNLGATELLAHDVEHYVQIARDLAGDRPRLETLRATLRQRMQESPVMNAPRFAREVESAYRRMWQRWCENPK